MCDRTPLAWQFEDEIAQDAMAFRKIPPPLVPSLCIAVGNGEAIYKSICSCKDVDNTTSSFSPARHVNVQFKFGEK
jgi:hypothetical protein